MSGVLVVAEHRRGELLAITRELLSAGQSLRDQGLTPLTVAVIGGDAETLAGDCGADGVDEVIAILTNSEHFEPHLTEQAIAQLVEERSPAVILTGQTVDSAGFAPALAASCGLGFASNVLSVDVDDGTLTAQRGVYGDRLIARLAFDHDTVVLMLRPGSHPPASPASAPVSSMLAGGTPQVRHRRFREPDDGGVDITRSPFLLSIGRGVDNQNEIQRFLDLADKLGATLSASRPLIDAGWLPNARQVGQSGRTVKPRVYLALGISGAVQHLAGIREARTVIAVNTDADAPIFSVADYGATLDLFDVADELEARA